jgi:hypothetical protein
MRPFYAGVTVGMLAAMYVCLIDAPPEWIDRKRRGRDAERSVEKQLLPLERHGWRIVHDVQHPWGNFDHVVVGPPGVFLLETKNLTGDASVTGDGELIVRRGDDERDAWSRPFGPKLKRFAFRFREDLLRATGARWVQPVVVLCGEFPEGETTRDGVVYLQLQRLRGWLEQQRTELNTADVERIGDYLDELEAAGYEPTSRRARAAA